MGLKLQVGKKYRRRDGAVVTVYRYDEDCFWGDTHYPYITTCGHSYRGNGDYHVDTDNESWDLIEEITEEGGDDMGRVKDSTLYDYLDSQPNLVGFTQHIGGIKYDEGKPDLSIVPLALLEAAARAFSFGEGKYGRNQYRAGFNTNKPLAALLRHTLAWQEGEDTDPESGLCHLDHAVACLAILVTNLKDGKAVDGRCKGGTE